MTAAGSLPPGGALVVGVGNPHRGDDGIGAAVAALVARAGDHDPRVAGARVRSMVQLAPELAAEVAEASVVVVVDARAGLAPGTVECRRVEVPAAGTGLRRALTHGFGAEDLAALAALAYGTAPPVYVVEVGAAGFTAGAPLSAAAAGALEAAAEAVAGVLAGHAPQRAAGR